MALGITAISFPSEGKDSGSIPEGPVVVWSGRCKAHTDAVNIWPKGMVSSILTRST